MALVLTESDVRQILTMRDGVRLVEAAFRHHESGASTLAPRMILKLSGDAGNFRIMAAVVPEAGGFGLKTLTGTPGKRLDDETYFTMLYFDIETGALLAVMPAAHITGIRTGAASGVATKYLSRSNAATLGLLGAGFQGRHQVDAIREVREITHVKIFDVAREPAAALAASLMSNGSSIQVTVEDSAERAVRGSDIIASATTATKPPIRGAWLDVGAHVNAAGANAPAKREVDAEGFRRARVIVDFCEQVLQEAGDVMDAIHSKAWSADSIHAELGEVVTGKKPGREDDEQITLFKSVGVAIEDVEVAAWVYEQAKTRGLGVEMNLQS